MALVDSFTSASSDSEWYKGLKRRTGSCLDLYDLLQNNRGLIHELGPYGKTVLHKGAHHGCVKLVKFVLVEMFDEAGNCNCKAEDNEQCGLTREELLRKTDRHGSTAVNIVLVSGSPKMVKLLQWAIEVCKCEDASSDGEEFDDDGYRSDTSVEEQRTISSGNAPEVNDEVFIENSFAPIMYGSDYMNRAMYDAVYSVISGELEKGGEWLDSVKESIKSNVDFQFVPIVHIILHFLSSVEISYWVETDESGNDEREKKLEYEKIENFVQSIIEGCRKHDLNKEGWMVVTLFNILDPQGRTILHAFHASGKKNGIFEGLFYIPSSMLMNHGSPLSKETFYRCMNATNGAGRTLSHLININSKSPWLDGAWLTEIEMGHREYQHLQNFELLAAWYQDSGIHTLHCWCIGNNPNVTLENWGCVFGSITPLHLAIIFDIPGMFSLLLEFHNVDVNKKLLLGGESSVSPFQLASIFGRTAMVERFMKHYTKVKNVIDIGFQGYHHRDFSSTAIHYAAMCGRSDTVQMILRYPIYDPICQTFGGTALHALVGMKVQGLYDRLKMLKEQALCYVLPSSPAYKRIKKDFLLLDVIGNVPRMFTNDEKTCINLLIQGGTDVWTTTQRRRGQQFPTVNMNGNNEARAWWFEKVVKEVESKKASITSAANATSVIGALVATTSFIGPLQPPSSYGDGDYIHMSRKAIQIYLVCNNFSIFFSIASILMAVLPAIPMSKESLYDEMLRSERCLKTAVAFLLVSIICIIASFSSASIAVVSPQWHERKFVVISIAMGGALCLFVLVIHIIRLLRMVFHKNNWLRRRFARHMYF